MAKKIPKSFKEVVATIIMVVSTTIIVFNNVGQTFQLVEIPFSKTIMYWVAGLSLLSGIIWESYLNKVLKI